MPERLLAVLRVRLRAEMAATAVPALGRGGILRGEAGYRSRLGAGARLHAPIPGGDGSEPGIELLADPGAEFKEGEEHDIGEAERSPQI